MATPLHSGGAVRSTLVANEDEEKALVEEEIWFNKTDAVLL
jgi:hypothetical protein